MKINRIFFAITLIASPLILNANWENSNNISLLGNRNLENRDLGRNNYDTVRGSRMENASHNAGIMAPEAAATLGGHEYNEQSNSNMRYGSQPERRNSGMMQPMNPLRK